ncbi:MAG: GlsB/YeaQ/YmgE family stress response membrane protein [Gammaproteobacteria bacterium]|nr:GlsB/YeaQ/YmgE family stress response membrane protein [Gammaproteobacteria bacterium]
MFKYVILVILAAVASFVFVFDMQLTNQLIGSLFIGGILVCFSIFSVFKFGLHYKIASLNRFATAFYYAVFEYKKVQTTPSDLDFVDSVREQAEVALAANFDPTLTASQLAIPVSLYSGNDSYLEELRAKIKEAEKLKLSARHLDTQANILLDKTHEDLVEKNLVTGEQPKLLDRWFEMVKGTEAIIDLTTNEVKDQGYGQAPDYEMISRIALDRNPHFGTTYRFFESEAIAGVLARAPFMIILLGIIGTFAGFYLALSQGGDIKSGAAVAIISSLVGLPTALMMEYINTLFPDQNRYERAFNTYKVAMELLFNHEQELSSIRQDRRQEDKLAGSYASGKPDTSRFSGPN